MEKRLLDNSRSDISYFPLFGNFWAILKSNNVDHEAVVLICDCGVLGTKLKQNFVSKRNLRFLFTFFENIVIMDGLQS